MSKIVKIEYYHPFRYRMNHIHRHGLKSKPCNTKWKGKIQITLNDNWLFWNIKEIYDHKWKRTFKVIGGWEEAMPIERYGALYDWKIYNKRTVLVLDAGINPVGDYTSVPTEILIERNRLKELANTLLNDNFFTDIKQVSWENVTTLV